jgi:hypothetical protein
MLLMEARVFPLVCHKQAVVFLALIGSFFGAVSTNAAGVTVGVSHDLSSGGRPVVEVKSKKVCNLCNDKGYCLDFANRSNCEQNKAIVQKTWDPSLQWSCSCSKQAAPSGGDDQVACCWISGNTATKICGKEDKVRKSLIISNPGKMIECSAAQQKSDIRLKRDIIRVARLDNGIRLYRYRYKWSDQVYVGVIAQEVALIVPDAVAYGPDGYLLVDYSRLGLHLMTWDDWVASGGVNGLKRAKSY